MIPGFKELEANIPHGFKAGWTSRFIKKFDCLQRAGYVSAPGKGAGHVRHNFVWDFAVDVGQELDRILRVSLFGAGVRDQSYRCAGICPTEQLAQGQRLLMPPNPLFTSP